MDAKKYVDDIIERYVYQVSKHLNTSNRKDIEEELRTLIIDMCERRTNGNPPDKEDLHAVLNELGSPYELAEKYRDKTRYLIGPDIFPAYLFILKIVIAATLFGMSVVTVLDLLTKPDLVWYEYLGSWSSNMLGGLFMAFAWVTVVFAIFEWKGVNLKELIPEFNVAELPPVPRNEEVIPLWEPILGIIFTVFGTILFALAPQLLGVFYYDHGLKTIPVFDLAVFRTVLPMFLIMMVLGISKNIWELFDRRYSVKYAVFTFIINTVDIILTVIVFTKFKIWNLSFVSDVTANFHPEANLPVSTIWEQVTSNLVIFLVVLYVLDTGSTIFKALKSR